MLAKGGPALTGTSVCVCVCVAESCLSCPAVGSRGLKEVLGRVCSPQCMLLVVLALGSPKFAL